MAHQAASAETWRLAKRADDAARVAAEEARSQAALAAHEAERAELQLRGKDGIGSAPAVPVS